MQFNIKVQNDFKNNIRREWALTNGLGGYAGGSVTGAINRTHQGYLILNASSTASAISSLQRSVNATFTPVALSFSAKSSAAFFVLP